MRKKLNEWADASKVLHGLVLLGFAVAIILSILSCEDDFHIGKTEEEIKTELYQTMFEVDSIIMRINYMLELDSTQVDGSEVIR